MQVLIRTGCFALLVAGLPLAPALAAAPDATQLRREVIAALEDVGGAGNEQLLVFRRVDVEPEGKAFRVTIDRLGVRLEPDIWTLGTFGFRITPRVDGDYDIDDLTAPAEMPMKLKRDEVAAHLGSASLSGVWSPKARDFLDLDMRIEKLEAEGSDGKAAIDNLTLTLTSKDAGGGRWNRATKLVVDGARIANDEDMGLSLGEIAVASDVASFDLLGWTQLRTKLQAAEAAGKPLDKATLKQLGDLGKLFGASKVVLRLADLTFEDKKKDGGRFVLPTAILSFGLSRLDQPLATVSMGLAYDGASIVTGDEKDDALAAALAPRRVSFSLSLEDLPTKQIFAALIAIGIQSEGTKSGKGDFAIDLLAAMHQAIEDAGSKLRIAPSEIDSRLVKTKLEGLAQASSKASLGGVAVFKFEVTGLDAAIAAAKRVLGEKDKDTAKVLDVLRLAGERHTESDGTVVDRYTFSLSPDGEMKINDKPFDSLFE